jgi:hypothetical protein
MNIRLVYMHADASGPSQVKSLISKAGTWFILLGCFESELEYLLLPLKIINVV